MLEDALLEYQDESKYATNGFLLALISFIQRIGCVAWLSQVELPMKEVTHSITEKIVTLLVSYMLGCRSTHAIETTLRPEGVAAELLGLVSFADHSAFSRFYARIDPLAIDDLRAVVQQLHEAHGLARHLEGVVVVDFDSTGLLVSGNQFELAEPGYFAKHRGAHGYQLSLACASNAGMEVLAQFLDPGSTYTGHRFWDLLYGVGERLGFLDERLFIRADRMYGVGAYVEHLIELEVGFLIKGRDPRTARRWVRELGDALAWLPIDATCWVADIGPRRLPNCRQAVRTILLRTWNERRARYEYSYLVTTLPWSLCSEVDVFHFYNQRGTMEKLIERCKNVWHVTHLPTHDFYGLTFYFELRFLAYNLVLWFQQYVLAEEACLRAMSLFELVTTLGPGAVVAERHPSHGWIFYLRHAPRLLQHLLAMTQRWLLTLADTVTPRLAEAHHVVYDWSQLFLDVWQAGPCLGRWPPTASCKT